MKKTFYILIIFMSSFFFYCHNAMAETYSINESDFDYLNDNFYSLREATIDFIENSNEYNYYLIAYNDNYNTCMAYIFRSTIDINFKFTLSNDSSGIFYYIYDYFLIYRMNNGAFEKFDSGSMALRRTFTDSSGNFSYRFLLDDNVNFKTNGFDLTLTYKNKEYAFNSEPNSVKTLYDIYLDNQSSQEEPFIDLEGKEVVLNFYTLVIEKIDLLVKTITQNYIFLAVFTIFIIIFVIELFRRLL